MHTLAITIDIKSICFAHHATSLDFPHCTALHCTARSQITNTPSFPSCPRPHLFACVRGNQKGRGEMRKEHRLGAVMPPENRPITPPPRARQKRERVKKASRRLSCRTSRRGSFVKVVWRCSRCNIIITAVVRRCRVIRFRRLR